MGWRGWRSRGIFLAISPARAILGLDLLDSWFSQQGMVCMSLITLFMVAAFLTFAWGYGFSEGRKDLPCWELGFHQESRCQCARAVASSISTDPTP